MGSFKPRRMNKAGLHNAVQKQQKWPYHQLRFIFTYRTKKHRSKWDGVLNPSGKLSFDVKLYEIWNCDSVNRFNEDR